MPGQPGKGLMKTMRLLLVSLLGAGVFAFDVDEVYKKTPTDEAVEKALEYLSKRHNDDGSWSSGSGKNTGVCGLAVLAFLANGHLPGKGKYGEVVQKGLEFILRSARSDGVIFYGTGRGPMYSHGISTILLAEVLGETPEENVQKVLDSAISVILKAQAIRKSLQHAGGWRYQPYSSDSDISCTGWQIVALRAAQNAGISIPKSAVEYAVSYLKRCSRPDGGFSYQPGGGPNNPRTGTGVLSLQLSGLYDSVYVKRGADYLLSHPPSWRGPFFFYSAYYCTNAMYQMGGKYWKFWKPRMESVLLRHQNPDGSWGFPPGSHTARVGPIYSTAMGVLALSIEYNYLPIYQR